MKKVLTLVLALALTLGCALGASAEEETYTIGICQLVQHDALDAAAGLYGRGDRGHGRPGDV